MHGSVMSYVIILFLVVQHFATGSVPPVTCVRFYSRTGSRIGFYFRFFRHALLLLLTKELFVVVFVHTRP